MGNRENAADALAHMPRWVAVHENVIAMAETLLAMAGGPLPVVDDALRGLDEARDERDRAVARTDASTDNEEVNHG
jgi:hypothetical protein